MCHPSHRRRRRECSFVPWGRTAARAHGMQRCRPRARGRAGAPPTWATQTLGFLISGQAMSETRIGDRLEHEFCQKKNRASPHGGKHTSLARVATTCMRRPPGDRPRPVRVPCAQSPSFSPSVSTLQYTRDFREEEEENVAGSGRTDDGDGGVRFTWTVMCLRRRYRVQFSSPLPSLPPWFVRRTSLDRRPSVCAAAAAAHEFSPARGGNEGAAPHRGQLRSALWIVI